ncbi:MAG: hypothetical protein K6E31_00935 [bacterium]|nr:hypothetical protein [bacterium]
MIFLQCLLTSARRARFRSPALPSRKGVCITNGRHEETGEVPAHSLDSGCRKLSVSAEATGERQAIRC